MAKKILFLDIDGPMIPGRALVMKGQTKPVMKTFDPIAVGMLNDLCQRKGWRIVIHSSWLRHFGEEETYQHCLDQGLKSHYFHKDAWCDGNINWRYTRIAKWLAEHRDEDIRKYHILDDEPYSIELNAEWPHPDDMEKHLILVDYFDGFVGNVLDQIGGRDGKALWLPGSIH